MSDQDPRADHPATRPATQGETPRPDAGRPPAPGGTYPAPYRVPAPGRPEGPFRRGFGMGAGAGLGFGAALLVVSLVGSIVAGLVLMAFTGAVADRPGRLELAGKGTLFLDEIAEISMDLQAKLLRVLQEKTYERVGDARAMQLEARVIAATHRDLQDMVKKGTFREDLYYRLRVVEIALPPLRDRAADIPVLVEGLLGKINRDLVATINGEAGSEPVAVGVSGEDAGLLTVVTRDEELGFVGDVSQVRAEHLLSLLDDGLVPVVSIAATVVTLLVTDGWQQVKDGVVALWRRFHPEAADDVEQALETSRRSLLAAAESGAADAPLNLEAHWRQRVAGLLTEHPEAATELDGLLIRLNDAQAGRTINGGVRMQARATGNGRIYQSAGDQTINER